MGARPDCPHAARLPRSVPWASSNCQGARCDHIVRLDQEVWEDPLTGRWWMAYSWFTNSPPLGDWERANHGDHVSITELDRDDPFSVKCDLEVPQIHAGNPQDRRTLTALEDSCPRCGEMLSFTRGRFGEEIQRDGASWGVNEGAGLFRRGDQVYVLMSGSGYDSPYYNVFWAAAPTVEQLGYDSGQRIVGRFLIPSNDQGFGHGTPVLGPDGRTWYYVHHRLDSTRCQRQGDCSRDVWISPIRPCR